MRKDSHASDLPARSDRAAPAASDAPGVRLRYDHGSLLVEGLAPAQAPEALPIADLVWDPRVGAHRCLAMHYRALVRALTHAGANFTDHARAYPVLPSGEVKLHEAFPYQREALAAWTRAKRGMVELPTGSGKTQLALQAAHEVGRGTLILVPTIDLLGQWATEVERAFGTPAGVLGGGESRLEPITVSTYASALRRGATLGDRFCLAVFDECHHMGGEGYAHIAEVLIAPYRLGLSATLERPDGRHGAMARLIGPVVFRRGITELSGPYLAAYRVETLEARLSADEQERYTQARGRYLDFARGLGITPGSAQSWQRFVFAASRTPEGREALKSYWEQKQIAFSAEQKFTLLSDVLHRHRDERVLIFTNDNPTAYDIARRFLLPIITHQTRVTERRTILEHFRAGRWPFIVTSRVLNEGVDVPDANVAVIVSGTAGVREHVQRLGRILRRAPGKEAVLYEVLTLGTGEQAISRRRREHDAYR